MRMQTEKKLTEKESLELITQMIHKAKDSYHDTGWGPIMWGVIIIVCALVTWARVVFKFSMPFDIWLLTLVAIVPQIVISYREGRAKKVKSYNDVAMDYIWISFGICLFLLIYTNSVMHKALNETFSVNGTPYQRPSQFFYNYQTALFLTLYGLPTFITGGIMKFKPMLFGGIFCWVCALISLYTPGTTDLLLMAASALFAWLIPGILINRNCRKKRQATHV
jgi:uncharacterized protein with PQ loop repeat